jgi:thymidylate synthase (FAD)
MPQVHPRIELLDYPTIDNLELIYRAARQCYSSDFSADIVIDTNLADDRERMKEIVHNIMMSGHKSIWEHAKVTFAIEGISRACANQLVRHRIATFSQQSQRYCVGNKDFNYIVPKSIKNNLDAKKRFDEAMEYLGESYEYILNELSGGNPDLRRKYAEDARFVLPNAAETKIVGTMNFHALSHFFNLRCCERAQWEIRYIAKELLRQCCESLDLQLHGSRVPSI